MISVTEARDFIINAASALPAETVKVTETPGRIAAEDITALRTHPPFDASAMDGYAVRGADMRMGAKLRIIGEAPAGSEFEGEVSAGEAVRIFTGGIIPDGADHVIIQEDVSRDDDQMIVTFEQKPPRHIRRAGEIRRAPRLSHGLGRH